MDFYDRLAQEYDRATAWQGRSQRASRFVDEFLAHREVRSALDVGCGTGLFALELARRGVRSTGVDPSAEMLARAEQVARREGLDVAWRQADLAGLGEAILGRFDAVLCVGNTIAHVLGDDELARSAEALLAVTAPGGTVAIQWLNYARLRERGERVVGAVRDGQRDYVRFYDIAAGAKAPWTFNLLSIDWSGSAPAWELTSAAHRPWLPEEIGAALEREGFEGISLHGGLGFGPGDRREDASQTLLARRPG
jgi:2-polyprenyl-3-methyl-5-hydroxy-6-metoxy-1,4-benzoquinol methylase